MTLKQAVGIFWASSVGIMAGYTCWLYWKGTTEKLVYKDEEDG